MPTSPGLTRLGRYAVHRRVELGMRTQREFAARTGLTERVIGKIETGHSVSKSTYAVLELVLEWKPGSADAVISGGEPEIAERPDDRPAIVRDNWDDQNVQDMWGLGVTEAQRLAFIKVYLHDRAASEVQGEQAG